MPVIPLPQRVALGTGVFSISDGAAIFAPPALQRLVRLFVDEVAADTGIRLTLGDDPTTSAIRIDTDGSGLDGLQRSGGVRADGRRDADERYALSVTDSGIRISAASAEGAHRGLTTVRHLLSGAVGGTIPQLELGDGPRFAWRGLALDVARHFHPADTVRRVIDMCSLYKLNVLHLHLTDDQGWRIPIPGRPELTANNADHYTADELDELVEYARDRFVTLVPEADMPGHVRAVLSAYPELRTGPTTAVTALPPFTNLDPENPLSWAFVRDVVAELARRFPDSAFIHIGGDEAFAMTDAAHAAFVDGVKAIVTEHRRGAIGWQETARADVSADDIVQYWMEPALAEAVSPATLPYLPADLVRFLHDALSKARDDIPVALGKGASVLVSPTGRLYFDRPHAAASVDPAQEEQRARLGLRIYPATTLRDYVDWEPADEVPGCDDESRIAGIEAAIWGETIQSRDDLEFLLLPRLPGAAEKAWAQPGTTQWPDYATRLGAQAALWSRRGWYWFRSSEIDWPEPQE